MAWYDGAWAAWQPKGAVDATAAKNDLTGNARHLTGASPTWSAANGFYSYAEFDLFSSVLTAGGNYTLLWFGQVAHAISNILCWYHAAGNWTGMEAHSWSDGNLYCGCNANTTPRFVKQIAAATDVLFMYQKKSDYSQRLLIDNSEVSGSPASGTANTDASVQLYTNSKLYAAGIWQSALTDSQMTAIYNALVLGISVSGRPLIHGGLMSRPPQFGGLLMRN